MPTRIESAPGLPWELDDLKEIAPTLVIRDEQDDLGRLVLRLGLAFNDLKGLIMLERYRQQFAPTVVTAPSAHLGQSGGILLQVHRYASGILHEALNVIHDERAAVDGAEFQTLVASLAPDVRQMWADLITEARNSPANVNQTGRALLSRLRNKTAFHYDGDKLLAAFKETFGTSATQYTQVAYYMAGVDMDGTRFFFADAAAEHDYKSAGTERGQITDAVVTELIDKVNNAFAMLIKAFLESRASGA